eukprot:2574754-Lingulodinium_polyedra.AAC.1
MDKWQTVKDKYFGPFSQSNPEPDTHVVLERLPSGWQTRIFEAFCTSFPAYKELGYTLANIMLYETYLYVLYGAQDMGALAFDCVE